MRKWCRSCLVAFEAAPEQVTWTVTVNGAVQVVAWCPRCGAATGPSFAPVAEAPATVQAEASIVARVHKRERAELRRYRNAAMVLLYVKMAPAPGHHQAQWDEPTVATLGQCFGLSGRRVKELLAEADTGAAAQLIAQRRRSSSYQRRPQRNSDDGPPDSEIKLPGTF